MPDSMLTKFFVYLRVGPVLNVGLRYTMLVGGAAFIALTIIAALFIPEDDELRFRNSSEWRRESQTLTGPYCDAPNGPYSDTPTVSVPVPAVAGPKAKEMNTYYNSLLDGGAANRLNGDLCNRLEVVHEIQSYGGSCTESEFEEDDDDENKRIV